MLIINKKDKKEVKQYLNGEFIIKNKTCKSSYFAALKHARELGGRNLKDGSIERINDVGSWPSACLYLTLIDHIGNVFGKKNKNTDSSNSFLKALENFTNLSEDDRKILYQLRCSFLHQFNLYNIKNKDYEDRHFAVHRGSPLIVFPKKKFNGNLKDISPDTVTKVSLPEIANLVENIHKEIIELLEKNELIINTIDKLTVSEFLNANILCY